MIASLLFHVARAGHFLAATDIEKKVVKTKDSFMQGLRNGNADAWSIVIILTLVVVGGGLAAYYFRNRG